MDIDDIITKMIERGREIKNYLIVRSDGTIVRSDIKNPSKKLKASTLGTAIFGVSNKVIGELDMGDLYQIIVSAEEGDIYITNIDEKGIIIVITEHGANSGIILLEMERAAHKLRKVM